ncbi:HD domain-containing phosphohydrolase [Mesorhizobium sp. CAU 1732]|uniref:HD domain-containing phosphohydrolase n=1 Tax=Mesorhizobium sp. CAU 1732 TaxID=3140358 RepID=UPI003260C37D
MKVLVVDDSRSSLAAIAGVVAQLGDCAVETCLSAEIAMRLCADSQFDLLLVDYVMPKMNGVDFIAALRASEPYRLVPIIMITSDEDQKLRLHAIEVGATDFLNKPFDWIELQARVRNLLALRRAQLELAERARMLAREVDAATRHIMDREEEVIWRLSRAIEYRDGTTGEHVSRVATVSRLIAEGMGFAEERARILYLAAPLHDIGKIGISDAILQKPGRLTQDEVETMRRHVEYGCRILEGGSSDLIRMAATVAASHHEKWDGSGYPASLAGEAIPMEGRIVAIADVLDALCSERPYKRAWPIQDAYDEILRCSGTHFDPACVEAFKAKWPDIRPLFEAVTNHPAQQVA